MASTATKDETTPKVAEKDTKDDKASKSGDDFSDSAYGELDARWQAVRSAETFYVLQFDPVPEVEADEDAGIEAQEAQPGKYIVRNTRTGEEKEHSEEEFAELNFQSVPPNKQI